MGKELGSKGYSKLEKQLHDDFKHLDEMELKDHLKAMKKDGMYTSGDKKLDGRLSKLMNFSHTKSPDLD